MRRSHFGLIARLPLPWSCANDPTERDVVREPGVLASGYGIADGIAVIGEGEFLFADRRGALYHHAGSRVAEVRGVPATRMSSVSGNRLVYIAYNSASYDLSVARFELRDDRADNLSVIYQSDESCASR